MKDKDLFVVGIGASAGGTAPLFDLFSNISAYPGVAFVIIRHLQRDYKSQMKALLSRYTHLPIFTIRGGEAIHPNCIYLMPENTNVEVQNHHFLLKERKMNEILNYAIDDFFISLSVDFKEKAVGIILSGMGTDGTKGGTAIEKAGGVVLVQHPESAEYSGMPNNAIDHDHPDFILSPQKMGKYLLEYINKQATADHRDTDGSESHRE